MSKAVIIREARKTLKELSEEKLRVAIDFLGYLKEKEEMHDTLFGAITSWIKSPLSNLRQLQKLTKFDDSSSPNLSTDNQELITNNRGLPPNNQEQITNNSSQSDVICALCERQSQKDHNEPVPALRD